jgi:hypothetical protein
VKSIQSLTCGSSCWQLLSHSYDKSSCSTFSIAPVILDDLRTSRMVAYRSGPCLVLSRALACGHVMKSDIWALKYCSVCCVIVGDVHSTNILSHLQPMMGDIQDLHNVQISFQTMPSVGRARLQMMQHAAGPCCLRSLGRDGPLPMPGRGGAPFQAGRWRKTISVIRPHEYLRQAS